MSLSTYLPWSPDRRPVSRSADEAYRAAVADVESFTDRSFTDVPELTVVDAHDTAVFSPIPWEVRLGAYIADGKKGYLAVVHELAHAMQNEARGVKGWSALLNARTETRAYGSLNAKLVDKEGFAEWVQRKHAGRWSATPFQVLGHEFYRAREALYGVEETVDRALETYPDVDEIRDTIADAGYGHALELNGDLLDMDWMSLVQNYYGD